MAPIRTVLACTIGFAGLFPGCAARTLPAAAGPFRPAAAEAELAPPTIPPNALHTTVPYPRADIGFHQRHKAMLDTLRRGGHELVFLGDSITQGWEGAGAELWRDRYAPRKAVNLGISGDRVQHVLWRLDNGVLEALAQTDPPNPVRVVVLMIGTNNSHGGDNTGPEIGDGIKAIVNRLRAWLPEAKVLLLGIFPLGEQPGPQREKNAAASRVAATVADGDSVRYLDISPAFVDASGRIAPEVMPDFVHLSPEGYRLWAEAMEPTLAEMLEP